MLSHNKDVLSFLGYKHIGGNSVEPWDQVLLDSIHFSVSI